MQLLKLLEEEIQYIVVEPIGDDERGVEFFIEFKNGVKQFHQCKARNASEEAWSVNNLKSRGVIDNILFQLDRHEQKHEFIFVSGVPLTNLGDICDSARTSPDDAEQFYKYQIEYSGPRTKTFKDFCIAANLDSENQIDRFRAYNYLKRMHMKLFPDDKEHLLTIARYILTGDPEASVAVMVDYIENQDRFGTRIYASELIAYLNEKEIFLKSLEQDKRIFPRMIELQQQFSESIAPQLIRGQLLERGEIADCIDALNEHGLVLLHGDAGKGKSGILYGITQKLKEQQVPFLPIRVDRYIPKDSAQHYGESLGLPDSPSLCIISQALDRPSVLIIDQLDAIRWTSSHSSNAMEVCKEMMRQVINARQVHKNIRVIISCRTFDLNFDPEIRHWLEEKNEKNEEVWRKIEVKSLSQDVVQRIGSDKYSELNTDQKTLLSNIQNLYMWSQLIDSGQNPLFQSAADLLEIFWRGKLIEIERTGVNSADVHHILDLLSVNMESNSQNSSPYSILSRCSPKAYMMLQSYGILQEAASRISFCHQSYLDYLIAMRALEVIEQGQSIVEWLGPMEKQTLFRREQLQQVLSFLSRNKILQLTASVRSLLFADSVRFHLKQLVLEIWSGIMEKNALVVALTIELLEDDFWNPYMIEIVFFNNEFYTNLLIENGYIQKWLYSADINMEKQAFWLLRATVDKIPDKTVVILDQLLETDEKWIENIHETLGWQLTTESESLFIFRLKLANKGYFPYAIDWKALCNYYPYRALQMIDVFLSRKDDIKQNARIEKWHRHDMVSLLSMAKNYPQETWDKLMPHILSGAKDFDMREFRKWKRVNGDDIFSGSIELFITAGKVLVFDNPDRLLEEIMKIPNQSIPLFKYIIAHIYTTLPVKYADSAITWLLKDISRLQIGKELKESIYKLSGELIVIFSPNCSQELFDEMERILLRYHGDEVDERKFYLKHKESKHYNQRLGLTQNFLLSRLFKKRISEETVALLLVFDRKFNKRTLEGFDNPSSMNMARFVGSTLDKNLSKISNRAWLEIVSNKKISYNRTGSFKDSEDGESYIESSVSQFSTSLERAANSEPERFANLLLSFPEDVNPSYVTAIFRIFERTQPESNIIEEMKINWQPVSVETILQCINKFYDLGNREKAIAFCRLIKERADEEWPDHTINKLIELATQHPDLEMDKLNIYSSGWDGNMESISIEDLEHNTINCVRGVAAQAIGNLLWEHPLLLEKLKPAIELLIKDPHPVIRMAAIYTLLPIINFDKELAVQWFNRIPQGDLRILAGDYGIKVISYTIQFQYKELSALIRMMLDSSNEKVSEMGGYVIAAAFIFYQLFEEKFENCCSQGSISQKKGMTAFATSYVGDKEYSEGCRNLLMRLIDSDGEDLREELSDMFRHNLLSIRDNSVLFKQYLYSKAYDENSFFMNELNQYEGDLLDYADLIFSLFDVFAARTKRNRSTSSRLDFAIDDAIKLLLRLYDQSKDVDTKVFQNCLNTWDLLFEKRIVYAKQILNELS